MARQRGGDNAHRKRKQQGARRHREVYVFAEGEVTEDEYAQIVLEHGVRKHPDLPVKCEFRTPTERKPLPLVEDAVALARRVRREARKAKLTEDDDRWPQVWCLFDRDQHRHIPEAIALAKREKIEVAYSHPCFELWRLLHYQNYTSTFGCVCNDARDRLRQQPDFAKTYGPNIKRVDDNLVKHVRPGQVLSDTPGQSRPGPSRYKKAKGFAQRLNGQHNHPDPCHWDPYTDVWEFVERALDVIDY
ncbi:RloB domain-containing protein [Streptomyces sp. A73]|nr:RloB domain-containing protein [Streptomyces sp. A73]